MRVSGVFVSLIAGVLGSGVCLAAGMTSGTAASSDPQTFVKKAAQDGMTEVQLGKLAQQKSSNADVKEFGARMVKDHSKANAELESVAKSKNLDVPKSLESKHRAVIDELKGKSGAEFDAAYAENMASDHAKAVDLFTQASQSSDAEIASFAKKTLPTLQEHKQMADSLSAKQRATASNADGSAGKSR
jgi:putative membrane protein